MYQTIPKEEGKDWKPRPQTWVMGKPLSGTAAVSVGFRPQVEEQHVATPRSFGVLVREQTLRRLQKTVQAVMNLYQSVREEIVCSLILIY